MMLDEDPPDRRLVQSQLEMMSYPACRATQALLLGLNNPQLIPKVELVIVTRRVVPKPTSSSADKALPIRTHRAFRGPKTYSKFRYAHFALQDLLGKLLPQLPAFFLNKAIARHLGVDGKTVAKALRWRWEPDNPSK